MDRKQLANLVAAEWAMVRMVLEVEQMKLQASGRVVDAPLMAGR